MATCSLLVKSQPWNVTPAREGLEACVEAGACGIAEIEEGVAKLCKVLNVVELVETLLRATT